MRKMTSTNSRNRIVLGESCVLNDALGRLALRWKMPVLHSIAHGATTYGELRKVLSTVSHQMLAKRLRELVDEGLAVKTEGRRGEPPSYAATPAAEAVLVIMEDICAWEKRYAGKADCS